MTENNLAGNAHYLSTSNGRVTGAIVDGWLVKIVQGSKHMLRSPKGWAIDAAALSVARTLGATGVRIEDRETGKVYLADWATIDAHGWTFDHGWGEQITLTVSHWQLQGQPVQAPLFA